MAEQIVTTILELDAWVVYGLVAFFSWAEASFFLGFVTPGELAIAGGGVLASRGQVMFLWVVIAAGAGTVVGNSTGYWLGRVWGNRLATWEPIDRMFGFYIKKAKTFVRERGEWAIVGSRVISYLRVTVPFIAGISGMRYRRFLIYDIPAGIVWAFVWTGVGFTLGESWRVLLTMAGPAAFLVLILFVGGLIIGWFAIRVIRRQDWIVELSQRIMTARFTVWVLRWLGPPVRWIGQRFTPGVAGGLQLTLGFLTLVSAAAAAGLVVTQTQAVTGLALLDFPVLEWMGETRTDEAVWLARTGLWLFRVPGFLIPIFIILVIGWKRADRLAGLRAAVGLGGAGYGALILDWFVLEGVVPGAEFPSVPVAITGALVVHAVAIGGWKMDWEKGAAAAAFALFLTLTVALATLVAGIAAPSGIVLGFMLGMAWAAMLELPSRIPWREVRG